MMTCSRNTVAISRVFLRAPLGIPPGSANTPLIGKASFRATLTKSETVPCPLYMIVAPAPQPPTVQIFMLTYIQTSQLNHLVLTIMILIPNQSHHDLSLWQVDITTFMKMCIIYNYNRCLLECPCDWHRFSSSSHQLPK